MSYYFGISFISTENCGAVFKAAKQFADVLAQKDAAREHLSNHIARFKDEVMFRYGDTNQWTLHSILQQ